MAVTRIELNGKQFDLQHPGARWSINLQTEIQNGGGVVDLLKLMESGFEHCVFPVTGEKLTIDNYDTDMETLNIWAEIFNDFIFKGKILEDKKKRWKIITEPKKKAEQN